MSSIDQLAGMFPDIERDVLHAMLEHHGAVERVVDALLETASAAAEFAPSEVGPMRVDTELADAELARSLQEGIDQEMARALQQELNQAAAPTSPPTTTAAERVAAVASGTKRLFQPLLQRAVKAAQAKGRGGGSHAVRLLDDEPASDSIDAPLASPLFSPPSPLVSAQYAAPTPPPVMTPTPPPTMTPIMAPTSSTRPNTAAEATVTPSPPTASKYNSRVERARQANKRLSGERPLPATLAPLVASPAVTPPSSAVLVPVGELI